jgi:hypothetical protein
MKNGVFTWSDVGSELDARTFPKADITSDPRLVPSEFSTLESYRNFLCSQVRLAGFRG